MRRSRNAAYPDTKARRADDLVEPGTRGCKIDDSRAGDNRSDWDAIEIKFLCLDNCLECFDDLEMNWWEIVPRYDRLAVSEAGKTK